MIAFRRGALANLSLLARAVLGLTIVLAASAVNPLQGGVLVGFGGAFIVVVPMLAFWVGRKLLTDQTLMCVIRLIAFLACVTALYGLAQSFVSLLPWDKRWVAESGYVALNVGGTTRAFGTFSSASEYATFLALGIVAFLVRARRLLAAPLIIAPVALLASALWFESSRSIIVTTFAAVVLMVCAAMRIPLRRSLMFGALLLALFPFALRTIAPAHFGTSPGSQLAAHQVEGLKDPFGSGSTLPGHIVQITEGMRQALANPLGRGIGSVTAAAAKFNGTQNGAEGDPGNAGIAGGILGLLLYLSIVILGFRSAYRVAFLRGDNLSLIALGMLTVTFLQWLNGGQYAVAFIPWLVLGWSDARRDTLRSVRRHVRAIPMTVMSHTRLP